MVNNGEHVSAAENVFVSKILYYAFEGDALHLVRTREPSRTDDLLRISYWKTHRLTENRLAALKDAKEIPLEYMKVIQAMAWGGIYRD